MIQVLYFARIRENVGTAKEAVALPQTIGDVAGLVAWLRERGGAWQMELAPGKALRVAVNQRMADLATRIADGDEVALFPPVTGG
jgi:sulfur-carrier protein